MVPLAVMVAMGIAASRWRPVERSPATAAVSECADITRGCIVMLGGERLLVIATTRPGTLTPFHLVVRGNGRDALTAEFSMRGMDMGFNRYRLLRSPLGWEGQVILPVCSASRRDWLLTLDNGSASAQIGFSIS